MSEQNLEAIQAAIAAFNRRDSGAMGAIGEVRSGVDAALALGRIRGRGRDSGVSIDVRAGWLARSDEGLIKSFQTIPDRGKALVAAGLSE